MGIPYGKYHIEDIEPDHGVGRYWESSYTRATNANPFCSFLELRFDQSY
jgi:hypothetical protein